MCPPEKQELPMCVIVLFSIFDMLANGHNQDGVLAD
jgi:hypothetical protein